jgi:hypothetical protein
VRSPICPRWLVLSRGSDGARPGRPPTPVLPDPSQRRYRYTLEGDNPPGGRSSAYDDGRKVYVEFSPGIVQGEMPPLFVIGPDGKPEIVNYRTYRNVLIVDRLFAAAELRLGVTPSKRSGSLDATGGLNDRHRNGIMPAASFDCSRRRLRKLLVLCGCNPERPPVTRSVA